MIDPDQYYPTHEAIDFYHHYKEDLALMEEMNFKAFRTSINWSIIYQNGDDESPNEAGLKYYDDLFDEMRKRGMEPIITLSHYETPVHLVEKYGNCLSGSYHMFVTHSLAVKLCHELCPDAKIGCMLSFSNSFSPALLPGLFSFSTSLVTRFACLTAAARRFCSYIMADFIK